MKPDVQYLLEIYTGDKIFEDTPGRPERSTEDEDHLMQAESAFRAVPNFIIGLPGVRNQGLPGQLFMAPQAPAANERIYGSLNPQQRQQIRVLVRELKVAANRIEIRPPKSLLAVEKAIVQKEGLDEEELQVVNNIHSIKTTTTISQIAEFLEKKLTSRTFRAALRFACYSATSVPEELAVVCELAKVTRPKIQQLSRSNSIYEVIGDFVQNKLDTIIR